MIEETEVESKFCSRCGVGTENYIFNITKVRELVLCSECCISWLQFATSVGQTKWQDLEDYAFNTGGTSAR